MRVAYVMPHSYEYMFANEIARMKSPDELDHLILVNSDHVENRYCKASLLAGIEPVFYYLSSLTKKVVELTHRDGYAMKKVPIDFKRGFYGKYGWEYSIRLLQELSADAVDAVFVFTYTLNPLMPLDMYDLLAIAGKFGGCPVVAKHGGGSARNLVLGKRSLPGKVAIKKMALGMAARIVVGSRKEYLFLNHEMKFGQDKLVYMQDPVDLARFHAGLSRETICGRLGKDPNKKYLLYVGRLSFMKGIQHLLNVLPRIRKAFPDIRLLIVGYGELEESLKRRVEELGLQNEVSFEGLVFHDVLPMYYNLADVFVLPSYDEGSPNVLQEAVACNASCIATRVGGTPDILGNGTGILVKPRDENGLFQAIVHVLNGNFKPNQESRKELLDKWQIPNFAETLRTLWEQVSMPGVIW